MYDVQLEEYRQAREKAALPRPQYLKPNADDLQHAKKEEQEAQSDLDGFLANVMGTLEARKYLVAHYKEFSSASLLPTAESAEAEPARPMISAELGRFQTLTDFYREATRASAELRQQVKAWRLYEQAVAAVAAVDADIATAVTRIGSVNQQITAIKQALAPPAPATAAAPATQQQRQHSGWL